MNGNQQVMIRHDGIAQEIRTLPDWLRLQAQRRGKAVALRHKRLGIWQEKQWNEVASEVGRLANALAARGFRAGATLVLLTHPRPEALLLSLAAQALGGIAAALDPTQPDNVLDRILRQLRPGFLFAEDQRQVDRVLDAQLAPTVILYADTRGLGSYRIDTLAAYATFLKDSKAPSGIPWSVRPEQTAFSFYRLDIEGRLESQQLSHGELLAEGYRLVDTERLSHREEALAARAFAAGSQARYLLAPWLVAGFTLNFPENLATRDNDRRELGPTLVLGTRETYARVADLVRSRLPAAGAWHYRLVRAALAPRAGILARIAGYWLVRRPLRDFIGFSRTRSPLLVGEPLPEHAAQFFQALGIAVRIWPDTAQWRQDKEELRIREPDAGAWLAARGLKVLQGI